jgi:hypothetical protein
MLQGAAAASGRGGARAALQTAAGAAGVPPEVAVLDDDHRDWMAARPEINSAAINKNDRVESPLVRYFGVAATSIGDTGSAQKTPRTLQKLSMVGQRCKATRHARCGPQSGGSET